MDEETNRVFLIIFFLIILVVSVFELGREFNDLIEDETDYIAVGCWKFITKTERSIAIMVSNRPLEEIIDTARHEICHDIFFRITLGNNYSSQASESFAETCIPEGYLYLDDEKNGLA